MIPKFGRSHKVPRYPGTSESGHMNPPKKTTKHPPLFAMLPGRWENMSSSSIPMLIMEFRCGSADIRLDKNRVVAR